MTASISLLQCIDTADAAPSCHNDDPAPPVASKWVRNLVGCVGPDVAQLGGKGLGLARLAQSGLPVPAGFCVTADAMRYYLAANSLDLDAFWRLPRLADAATLSRRIRDGRCPDDLRQEMVQAYLLLGHAAVAVRSSAVDEDGADRSFAGQHQTFLNVVGAEAVVRQVQACWASLLQPAALAYRDARGAHGMPAMAVVVQAMVHADSAGVAFARDPLTGDPDRIVVEACYGLGEGLVASRVSADSYTVAAPTMDLIKSRVQYKSTALCWDPACDALTEQPVEEAQRAAPVLAPTQVLAIAQMVRQVSEQFGAPQDVEWAYADGVLSLLQSRPITASASSSGTRESLRTGCPNPQADRLALWSRMDIGEIFTGRMTPLGISFARYYQHHVHRDCGAAIGLLDPGDPAHYMGYLNGHVYLNVAYTAYMLSQSPPGFDQRPFVQRFSSEEVNLSGYVNPYGMRHRHPDMSRTRTSAHWAWAMLKELLTAKSRARRMVASRHVEYDRAIGLDLRTLSLDSLHKELTHALGYFKEMHIGYLPFYINAFGLYGLLEQLCVAWLPGDGKHLQNRLKGDMSNLRTVQSARDLWALTQALDRHPRVKAMVRDLPAHQLAAALQSDEHGQRFWRGELAAFMRDNGVRAREEMELTNPRWVDDPTYVFQMVKTFLAQGYEVDNRLGHAARHRATDTEALLRRLPWPRRAVMRRVIALYSACSRLREETRMSMITSIWLVRRVLCETARRLVADGVLRSDAELGFVTFDDLQAYLGGHASAHALFARGKLDASRRLHESYLDDEPPLTFVGHAEARRIPAVAPAGAAIEGLGTSIGRVRGQARVIHDLAAQAGELRKGEIIVTRFTDASWTPLFALAGGVVTDIGSMLSHSSIVAREFGIPSVVNTQVCTARIKTGDWLLVDGEAGLVCPIEAQEV